MRAVLTRVRWARVSVAGEVVGAIDSGICALLGVGQGDTEQDARWIADKICGCRFFRDDAGKMNRSLLDGHGGVLLISQFTLYGDVVKGRRPSFVDAARPEQAIPMYESFVSAFRTRGVDTETGEFGAAMQVDLVNDGPVTLWLER